MTALAIRSGIVRLPGAWIEKLHEKWLRPVDERDAIVYATRKDGSKFRMDLRMEFVSYYLGEYEPHHLKVLLSFLPPGGTFVDVGANIGYFAVTVGHRRRDGGCRVYAFEPLAANFAVLTENIELNRLKNVISAYPVALSNQECELTMQVFANTVSQTANAVILSNWRGYEHLRLHEQVKGVRFDEWARLYRPDRIDVAKIDVEGHELQVFEGMIETLHQYKPVIYAECNISFFRKQSISFRAVHKLLSGIGYKPYQLIDTGLKRLISIPEYAQDVFFMPD